MRSGETDAPALGCGIRLAMLVAVRRRDRDEDHQPGEDERERDDLEDGEVEHVERVVGDHRTRLHQQRDRREPHEGARHSLGVPWGADAEQREPGGRAESERVVQVGRLRDRNPPDAHEAESDEPDE